MAGNATFPRALIRDLQKAEAVDLNRAGLFASAALQQVVAALLAGPDGVPRSGFFGSGFRVVPTAGGLDCEVVAGLGFQYDTTGLGTDESPYRVLQLPAAKTIQVNGGAPAPGATYYVWAKYGSQDGRSENRLVRPAVGQPFGASSTPTVHEPFPSVVINTDAGYGTANKYELLATVGVPGGGASTSADYTIVDRRTLLRGRIYVESLDDGALAVLGLSADGPDGLVVEGQQLRLVPASGHSALLRAVAEGAGFDAVTKARVYLSTPADNGDTPVLELHADGRLQNLSQVPTEFVRNIHPAAGQSDNCTRQANSLGFPTLVAVTGGGKYIVPIEDVVRDGDAIWELVSVTLDLQGGTADDGVAQLVQVTETSTASPTGVPVSGAHTIGTGARRYVLSVSGDYTPAEGDPVMLLVTLPQDATVTFRGIQARYARKWLS